jgi:hypothetical protein
MQGARCPVSGRAGRDMRKAQSNVGRGGTFGSIGPVRGRLDERRRGLRKTRPEGWQRPTAGDGFAMRL